MVARSLGTISDQLVVTKLLTIAVSWLSIETWGCLHYIRSGPGTSPLPKPGDDHPKTVFHPEEPQGFPSIHFPRIYATICEGTHRRKDMTFSSAIRYLSDGKAAKTPTMMGYVYRTDFQKGVNDQWKEKYTIGFKERSDSANTDGDSKSLYAYVFTVASDGNVTVEDPSGGMKLDGQLLQCLASDTWEIYDQSVLETTRTGTSMRW